MGGGIKGDAAAPAQVRRPGMSGAAEDRQGASIGSFETGDETGQGGLARAVGAEHAKTAARFDGEGEAFHAATVGIVSSDISGGDGFHGG